MPSIRVPSKCLPGVLELIRVTKPYKLASREMHEADTVVKLPQRRIGPGTFTIIAGPCSVENEEMILRTAEFLREQGVNLMRAGAFKPRTQPLRVPGDGTGRVWRFWYESARKPASASSRN